MIRRNENRTLDASWFEDNVLMSPTACTVTLKQGSTVLLDEVAATTIGGPTDSATLDILAALTTDLSFSDTILELWTFTGGAPPFQVTARRSGHLVRSILYPLIHDSDLLARHQRLNDIRPPTLNTFEPYRDTAWEVLNRDLIKQGRRPELILDSYAIIDMHIFKSLELIFRDAITFVGDGRYNDLAVMYAEKYTDEWQTVVFRYDRNENDAISDSELEAVTPSTWLGEPPPGGMIRGLFNVW
jgi:hypothetical protein